LFDLNPFVLQAGTKTGLKIRYRNPLEVGADRIANAIAATRMFPQQNLIVVDYGTATTFCAITADRDYLGGLILPGFRISMEALESRTAKLPSVELLAPEELIGKSTVESIQSGLYFSNLYAVRGITEQIKKEYFGGKPALVLGTGGFSRMFENDKVFDSLIPELVLLGLREALKMNA
jgi:type III pantothenate kinase